MNWQIVVTSLGATFEALSAMDGPICAGKRRKKQFSKSLGEAARTEHAPWYPRPLCLIESRLRRRCGARQQIGHQKISCMPME
jgi:hypothetical protein